MVRKRKARKRRRPSSARKRRRKAPSGFRRCSDPSSDVDFIIEENTDDDDDDDDYDNEEDENDDDGILNLACGALDNDLEPISRATRGRRLRNSRPPRPRREDLDDDFDIELQKALENDFFEKDMKGVLSSSFGVVIARVEPSVSEDKILRSISSQPEATCHKARTDTKISGMAENHDAENDKRKGKQKVLEESEAMDSGEAQKDDEIRQLCGVCLTEKPRIERGKLDCCDHFFCFGCIMEWAKVESRCPMCKQRFVTIVKHGGHGKRTRTVRVPTRNQIYEPPDAIMVDDPYADVVCMECQGNGDEGLLLLCDRCDAAAHTFCVGLGTSVPQGDWFCRECQASRPDEESDDDNKEALTSETENLDSEEDEDSILRAIVASPQSRIHKPRKPIVRTSSRMISRSRLPNVASRRRAGSSVRRRIMQRLLSHRRGETSVKSLSTAVSTIAQTSERSIYTFQNTQVSEAQLSNPSAETVQQRRTLQKRIDIIRSNWDRIQNGNLQFDAICRQADSSTIIQGTISPIEAARSKSTLESGESSKSKEKELQQAWQMMSAARKLSVETNLQASDSLNQQINRRSVQPPSNNCHSMHSSEGSSLDANSSTGTRPNSFGKNCEKHKDGSIENGVITAMHESSRKDECSSMQASKPPERIEACTGTRPNSFGKNCEKHKDGSIENDAITAMHESSRKDECSSMQASKPPERIEACKKINDVRNPHVNVSSRSSADMHGSLPSSKSKDESIENGMTHETSRKDKLLSSLTIKPPERIETCEKIKDIPQQHTLCERIEIIRCNWERKQNGNLQLDAICRQANCSIVIQGTISLNEVARSKSTMDSGEYSTNEENELQQAWQMMSAPQKTLVDSKLQGSNSLNPQVNRRFVQPPSNDGHFMDSPEGSSVDADSRASFISKSIGIQKDESVENSMTNESSRKHKIISMQKIKPPDRIKTYEKINDTSNPHLNKSSRIIADMHESYASSKNRAGPSSSQGELKIHLTELVKKQLWPLYLLEKLDKEQFKQIARFSVFALLTLCDSKVLSCSHLDDRDESPPGISCNGCFNSVIEKVVKIAIDKLQRVGNG